MSASGSPIVLEADPGGVLPRLIEAAATLAAADLGAWALVGGLAVMLRLGGVHRVTADIDSVIDDSDGAVDAALTVLLDSHRAHWSGDDLHAANGAKVDIIRVYDYLPEDLPDDTHDRMFVISHRWALDTATVESIAVTRVDGSIAARATVPIADRASLVAMKLGAHQRPQRTPVKRACDVFDLYRLLDAERGLDRVAERIAEAPDGFARWCASAISATFIDGADHWARQLHIYSRSPGMEIVDSRDLEVVGSLAAERIGRAIA